MGDSSHFDESGASRMVNIGEKPITERMAVASGRVCMSADTVDRIRERDAPKGDVLEVARLAGIMAAKRTAELIPLCHPLPLDAVDISFSFPEETAIAIQARTRVSARTGVEMEALTAVSVAALTIYDMCKSIDREMVIDMIQLEEKLGGRSGHFGRTALPDEEGNR